MYTHAPGMRSVHPLPMGQGVVVTCPRSLSRKLKKFGSTGGLLSSKNKLICLRRSYLPWHNSDMNNLRPYVYQFENIFSTVGKNIKIQWIYRKLYPFEVQLSKKRTGNMHRCPLESHISFNIVQTISDSTNVYSNSHRKVTSPSI